MPTLEELAREAWKQWGVDYAMHTRCGCCAEMKYCRRTRHSRWLCLGCFDQGNR